MNSRMKRISAALAFAVAGITTSAMAQEVAKQNQAVADSVVDSLRKSGQFKGSRWMWKPPRVLSHSMAQSHRQSASRP